MRASLDKVLIEFAKFAYESIAWWRHRDLKLILIKTENYVQFDSHLQLALNNNQPRNLHSESSSGYASGVERSKPGSEARANTLHN